MTDDISVGIFVHERIKFECLALKDTFLRYFTHHLFFGAAADAILPTHTTTHTRLADDYSSATPKQFYCLRKQLELHRGCRWFYVAGYDIYLHPVNLAQLLAGFDSSIDLYIGGHGDWREINGQRLYFASGGPGIVLSRSLTEKLCPRAEDYIEEWKDPRLHGSVGYPACDVALAYFLRRDFGIECTAAPGFYHMNYDAYLPGGSEQHSQCKLIANPVAFHNVRPVLTEVPRLHQQALNNIFPFVGNKLPGIG